MKTNGFFAEIMLIGYALILLAAMFWGGSVVLAKHLNNLGMADALLLSQARVTFAWLVLAVGMLIFSPGKLRVSFSSLLKFSLLGLVSIAGANFFLYYAVGKMNPAVADLIQFTAPVMVTLWMWRTGEEPLDKPKIFALLLSVVGSGFALGAFSDHWNAPALAVASALLSAVCYACLIIYGKSLGKSYSIWVYLHYALLAAAVFWMLLRTPVVFYQELRMPGRFPILFLFSMTSILIPYSLFFIGLKRVSASRAGIVSTFEPVTIALGAWLFLNDSLSIPQVFGVVLVILAIVTVELTSGREKQQVQA